MSALSKPQFEQLPMFMQAKALHSEKTPKWDQIEGETHDELMAMKLDTAQRAGLYHDIKHHGVQEPVELHIEDKGLLNGHHRVASAFHINPESWLPVKHSER